MLSKSICFWN